MDAHKVVRRRDSHIFQKMGSQMAIKLSAVRSGRPLPQERFLVLICVRGCVDPRAIVRLEGLDQLKKSRNLIGIRSRNLPACSIVPQLTTLPRVPSGEWGSVKRGGSVSALYSVQWQHDWWWIGMEFDGSGRCLTETVSAHLPGVTEERYETSVRLSRPGFETS
jgi:hypothetical protein